MKEPPYAWVVVWATFVCLALIFGVSYSFAAFFESFAVEFSAQRADVSWIFGLSGFVYFVMGAGGGMLADRFGPRIVCSAGMALIALGLLATSWASSLLTVYVSYGLLVGLGIALVYTPSIASVQPWFTTRRGLAGGIASSGVGAGTLLVPVLVAMAIGPMPWREAMQVLALGVLVLGVLAAALLRSAPAAPSSGSGGSACGLSLRETLRSPTFRWLYLATVLASLLIDVLRPVLPLVEGDPLLYTLYGGRSGSGRSLCGRPGGLDWRGQSGRALCHWPAGRPAGTGANPGADAAVHGRVLCAMGCSGRAVFVGDFCAVVWPELWQHRVAFARHLHGLLWRQIGGERGRHALQRRGFWQLVGPGAGRCRV